MSALDEIRAALKASPSVPEGGDRVVLVGDSARRSIATHGPFADDDFLPQLIAGVVVQATDEFPGWAIRDRDRRGRWHEIEPTPATSPKGAA